MAIAIRAAERFRRALEWERAVITLSFWFCLIIFLGPGILLGKFVAPALIGTRPAELSVLVHLSVGGFVGLVCLGTVIIAAGLLWRMAIDAIRAKIGSG